MTTAQKKGRHEANIRRRFGELLDLKDLTKLLRYPSVEAARQAYARRQFPIQLIKLPNRRGLFATCSSLARYLEELDEIHARLSASQSANGSNLAATE